MPSPPSSPSPSSPPSPSSSPLPSLSPTPPSVPVSPPGLPLHALPPALSKLSSTLTSLTTLTQTHPRLHATLHRLVHLATRLNHHTTTTLHIFAQTLTQLHSDHLLTHDLLHDNHPHLAHTHLLSVLPSTLLPLITKARSLALAFEGAATIAANTHTQAQRLLLGTRRRHQNHTTVIRLDHHTLQHFQTNAAQPLAHATQQHDDAFDRESQSEMQGDTLGPTQMSTTTSPTSLSHTSHPTLATIPSTSFASWQVRREPQNLITSQHANQTEHNRMNDFEYRSQPSQSLTERQRRRERQHHDELIQRDIVGKLSAVVRNLRELAASMIAAETFWRAVAETSARDEDDEEDVEDIEVTLEMSSLSLMEDSRIPTSTSATSATSTTTSSTSSSTSESDMFPSEGDIAMDGLRLVRSVCKLSDDMQRTQLICSEPFQTRWMRVMTWWISTALLCERAVVQIADVRRGNYRMLIGEEGQDEEDENEVQRRLTRRVNRCSEDIDLGELRRLGIEVSEVSEDEEGRPAVGSGDDGGGVDEDEFGEVMDGTWPF